VAPETSAVDRAVGAPAPGRSELPPGWGPGDVRFLLKVAPGGCFFLRRGGDSYLDGVVMRSLNWKHWGAPKTRARGKACAAGCVKATVTLSWKCSAPLREPRCRSSVIAPLGAQARLATLDLQPLERRPNPLLTLRI
jgi:hypothetical protein